MNQNRSDNPWNLYLHNVIVNNQSNHKKTTAKLKTEDCLLSTEKSTYRFINDFDLVNCRKCSITLTKTDSINHLKRHGKSDKLFFSLLPYYLEISEKTIKKSKSIQKNRTKLVVKTKPSTKIVKTEENLSVERSNFVPKSILSAEYPLKLKIQLQPKAADILDTDNEITITNNSNLFENLQNSYPDISNYCKKSDSVKSEPVSNNIRSLNDFLKQYDDCPSNTTNSVLISRKLASKSNSFVQGNVTSNSFHSNLQAFNENKSNLNTTATDVFQSQLNYFSPNSLHIHSNNILRNQRKFVRIKNLEDNLQPSSTGSWKINELPTTKSQQSIINACQVPVDLTQKQFQRRLIQKGIISENDVIRCSNQKPVAQSVSNEHGEFIGLSDDPIEQQQNLPNQISGGQQQQYPSSLHRKLNNKHTRSPPNLMDVTQQQHRRKMVPQSRYHKSRNGSVNTTTTATKNSILKLNINTFPTNQSSCVEINKNIYPTHSNNDNRSINNRMSNLNQLHSYQLSNQTMVTKNSNHHTSNVERMDTCVVNRRDDSSSALTNDSGPVSAHRLHHHLHQHQDSIMTSSISHNNSYHHQQQHNHHDSSDKLIAASTDFSDDEFLLDEQPLMIHQQHLSQLQSIHNNHGNYQRQHQKSQYQHMHYQNKPQQQLMSSNNSRGKSSTGGSIFTNQYNSIYPAQDTPPPSVQSHLLISSQSNHHGSVSSYNYQHLPSNILFPNTDIIIPSSSSSQSTQSSSTAQYAVSADFHNNPHNLSHPHNQLSSNYTTPLCYNHHFSDTEIISHGSLEADSLDSGIHILPSPGKKIMDLPWDI